MPKTTCRRKDCRRRRKPDNEVKRDINFIKFQQPIDEDRFYVIEKLLSKRYDQDGNEEYLVRWQNYPPEWDSWEPRQELERNSLDMINEFNRTSDPNNCREQLHCICKQPYRFDQGGMIQCFNCHQWFHFKCLNMNMEEANSYAKYNCQDCLNANPNLKNLIKLEKLEILRRFSEHSG